MYENFLPDRLAELRMQKGISARDMSLSLGQANNYINTIENKKSLPSMQSFFYICEFLNITPQEFFDGENENPQMLKELVDEAKKLDYTSLTHILGVMKAINHHK
ncbi:MAG: helix-turn-helix domain-containing protein [Lachnospiraceae bacterium]|nr:helix-turn-helix domain-containing protein [Lachnospiraceae bacterium]